MSSPDKGKLGAGDFIRAQIKTDAQGDLVAPDNIITTVSGARAVYYQYRAEHLRRIDLAARIEGLLAGNPPYSPTELAQQKLSHIANFNNLDARALYERGAQAYWNLLNEAEFIAEFQLDGDVPELYDYSVTLSRRFNEVLRSWPSFDVVYNTLTGQLVRFGVSPLLWPDERDWRPRAIEYSRFFVEDQAQTDIDLLTVICVESIFTAQYLFEVYNKFKDVDPKKSPWNVQELEKLLLWKANTLAKTEWQFFDMMDIQRRIQNGDLTFNAIFTDDIRIISFFQVEYDGKVSHAMFERLFDGGDFIYYASKQYDSLSDAVLVFTASPGEFTIHSNRGLGHKIFAGSQAMMQLDCSIIDMARMSSTPLIKTPATGNKDFETIRFYPGVPTSIGNAEFVDNKLGSNINQLIQASQYMFQKINYNISNSGDDPSMPDKDKGSISPTQARMQSYREFGVLKNNIAHFYSQFDRVIRNIVVKMLNSKEGYPGYEYAKEWKRLCIQDGVPEEIFNMARTNHMGLPQNMSVKATRVAGDGSTLARILGLQEILPIVDTFGPGGQKEFQRQTVLAALGPQAVPAFLSDAEETEDGDSLAGVENAVMQMGQSPVFSSSNLHTRHFVTHMALGNHIIKQIEEQQLTPLDADKQFTVLIPHMQDHWGAIIKSVFSRKFSEQMKRPWKQLSDYASLNRKNANAMLEAQLRKQQEQEQQQQQVMSDEQRKDFQAQKAEARADFKVKAQVSRADEANRTRADVQREKVHLDADNKRLKTTLDANVKSQELSSTENIKSQLETNQGQTPSPSDFA